MGSLGVINIIDWLWRDMYWMTCIAHVKIFIALINVLNAFITLINYLINTSVSFINVPINRLVYCNI